MLISKSTAQEMVKEVRNEMAAGFETFTRTFAEDNLSLEKKAEKLEREVRLLKQQNERLLLKYKQSLKALGRAGIDKKQIMALNRS